MHVNPLTRPDPRARHTRSFLVQVTLVGASDHDNLSSQYATALKMLSLIEARHTGFRRTPAWVSALVALYLRHRTDISTSFEKVPMCVWRCH